MAKKQTFGEKVIQQKKASKNMAKIVSAEKKENGEYRFRAKMVRLDQLQDELKNAARLV